MEFWWWDLFVIVRLVDVCVGCVSWGVLFVYPCGWLGVSCMPFGVSFLLRVFSFVSVLFIFFIRYFNMSLEDVLLHCWIAVVAFCLFGLCFCLFVCWCSCLFVSCFFCGFVVVYVFGVLWFFVFVWGLGFWYLFCLAVRGFFCCCLLIGVLCIYMYVFFRFKSSGYKVVLIYVHNEEFAWG